MKKDFSPINQIQGEKKRVKYSQHPFINFNWDGMLPEVELLKGPSKNHRIRTLLITWNSYLDQTKKNSLKNYLKNSKVVSQIYLNFNKDHPDRNLYMFREVLKNVRVSKVFLSHSWVFQKKTANSLKGIWKSIGRFNTLGISCYMKEDIGLQIPKHFRTQRIQELTYKSFHSCENPRYFQKIFETFGQHLRTLNLCLLLTNLKANERSFLLEQISKLSLLRSLQLKISEMDSDDLTIASSTIANLSNLETLTLNSNIACVSKESFSFFTSKLGNCISLKDLSLSLVGLSNLDDGLFDDLARSLLSLQKLEGLSLNISQCINITDAATTNFPILLSRLPNLTTFRFSGQELNITNEMLNNLSKAILRKPDILQIHLDFSSTNIDSQALIELGNAIRKLQHLKNLQLNFESCKNIGNEGYVLLVQSFVTQKELESVKLNFNSCSSIGNEGVIVTANYLLYCKNLREVSLHWRKTEVSRQAVDDVIKGLSKVRFKHVEF